MESEDLPAYGTYVEVKAGDQVLEGDLSVPPDAQGLLLFAHGSGSSRRSARNRYVAGRLQNAGFATLLIDLLTPREEKIDEHTHHLRFDIPLLSRRFLDASDWVCDYEETRHLPIGAFGASTGAAAALITAAKRPDRILAVVARGGRPDLAKRSLRAVRTPTLFVVGEKDPAVIELNRQAMALMRSKTELVIVPGASHLFEEPGKLEEVARLAASWFVSNLASFGRRPDAAY